MHPYLCMYYMLFEKKLINFLYLYNKNCVLQSSENVQLEFEIRIQFGVMYLNLCGSYIIIIHLILCHVYT